MEDNIEPAASGAGWLADTLDEVDYGLLVVTPEGRVCHANYSAQARLVEGAALRIAGGLLQAQAPGDARALAAALQDAALHDRRSMLRFGSAAETLIAALTPLPGQRALVALQKPRGGQALALQWFAQCHRLTPAEQQVLQTLCAGAQPREVALRHRVSVTTVRSQIGSIRQKTGAPSIGALVRQVAELPPFVNALRGSQYHGT